VVAGSTVQNETTPDHALAASAAGSVEAMATMMRRLIERGLTVSGDRMKVPGGAATTLEISPHTLNARMLKRGVEATCFHDYRSRGVGGTDVSTAAQRPLQRMTGVAGEEGE